MGLSLNEGNGIFLSTFDGFFERKLKEPKPGSIQRVNKNGETINVLRFNTLIGKIAKVEYKHTEKYGDFWSVTVVDDQIYKLDLSVASSSTFYFLNRLLNADLNLKATVELKVFAEVENDKKKTVILVKQAGVFINGVYTKDNPQDLPPMKQVMFKGKLEWDSTERDIFMRNLVEKCVVPELDAGLAPNLPEDTAHLDAATDDADLPPWAKDHAEAMNATAPKPTAPAAPVAAKQDVPKQPEAKSPPNRRGFGNGK